MGTEDDKPSSKCPSIECQITVLAQDMEKDVESAASSPVQETPDGNIVDWAGPSDHNNPQNWSLAKKGVNILILSILTFLTPLASSMFAPGVPQLMKEFHSDK
jgi:hypothetical protein